MADKINNLLKFGNEYFDTTDKRMVLQKINGILEQNQNKNFVRRIITPDIYPKFISNVNGQDIEETHRMAWGEHPETRQPIVYPTIVYDPGKRTLMRLDPNQARDYAIQNNEFIPVTSPEEADWLSKNYKQVWEKPTMKESLKNEALDAFDKMASGSKEYKKQIINYLQGMGTGAGKVVDAIKTIDLSDPMKGYGE